MWAEAQGFLLLGFAITYVVTSPENAIIPNSKESKVSSNTLGEMNDGKATPETVHGMEKREAMFTPDYPFGQRINNANPKFILENEDLEKRSRMGFTGMRGKKDCSNDEDMDNCGQIEGSNDDDETEMEASKRALRGFGGWFGGKRAPLSFHGMRGKKADEMTGAGSVDEKATMANEEFLINTGLLDEDGSKTELELPDAKLEEEILDEEPFNKRSPYSFQGMRGKKNNLYDLKRAMGFLGMRGKKGTQFWYPYGYYKRVPQSSFFGMKGKKAQFNGFFGMRGKKASIPPFLDLQDKQEPLAYDLEDLRLRDDGKESESSRNRFRRGTIWLNNSKKAKNAFFGVRGKKAGEESFANRFSSPFE